MNPRYPKARSVGFSLLLFCTLAMSGCCVHEPAIKACERGIAGTTRYMNHPDSLPQTVKLATECHDVFWQIELGLGEIDKLPTEVQARKGARDALAAAGDPQ